MAALSADRLVPSVIQGHASTGYVVNYGVEAAEIVYKGALVEVSADGYAQAANVGTGGAGIFFLGIALEQSDNSASGAANGDTNVDVLVGAVIEHAVAGATVASIGDEVYASDDQTLTTTATSNVAVGWVVGHVSGTTCIVQTLTPAQDIAFA